MRRVNLAFIASATILAATPALAQAPLVEKNVSMALSMAVMQAALDQCTKDGYKVSVVIVDKGGNVAASVRGDGTGPHTMEFARMKAYTARTRSQTSLATMKQMEDPANAFIRQIPNVVGVGGGVPIKAGNEVIGGVGVSGAPGGEKDEVCANAGLARPHPIDASPVSTLTAWQSISLRFDIICASPDRLTLPGTQVQH